MYQRMSLCKYKNIFGAPNTGIHKYRILDIAIVDTLATLILAWLITRFTSIDFNVFNVFLGLVVLSILVHRLFCVETTLTKLFFNM